MRVDLRDEAREADPKRSSGWRNTKKAEVVGLRLLDLNPAQNSCLAINPVRWTVWHLIGRVWDTWWRQRRSACSLIGKIVARLTTYTSRAIRCCSIVSLRRHCWAVRIDRTGRLEGTWQGVWHATLRKGALRHIDSGRVVTGRQSWNPRITHRSIGSRTVWRWRQSRRNPTVSGRQPS